MPGTTIAPDATVYVLTLKDDGSPDITGPIINLPAPRDPYILRFAIGGASPINRDGTLHINIPPPGKEFQRDQFRDFKLESDLNRTCYIDLPVTIPGSFDYYITYSPLPDSLFSDVESKTKSRTKTHHLTVSVGLTIKDQYVPRSALSIFSVVSKWLGSLEDWEDQFANVARRGYNAVHFTPLNVRGASNSPYSLKDQNTFDTDLFTKGEKQLLEFVKTLEKKHGLLSITDVVWNHTAPEAEWLQEHPDAGYNMITAPWLESAIELDIELQEFSGKFEALGLPTDIKSKEDILTIMKSLETHVIGKLRLWEYFVIDVKKNAQQIIDAWVKKDVGEYDSKFKSDDLKVQTDSLIEVGLKGMDRLGERFRRHVDPKIGAAFLNLNFGEPKANSGEEDDEYTGKAREFLTKVLDTVNLPLYKQYDADAAEITEQIYNRINYQRLDPNGPKYGPIDSKNPVTEIYFTKLPHNKTTAKHPKGALFLANNGWIWASNPLVDFAGPKSRAYLRREVISWGDCVKLRYGEKPEDSPYLWEHMRKYSELMAKCFAGFRVDNCHSTPLHVAEYLLDAARRVNNNLYVMAELFTGDENMDRLYVQRLGLGGLIREAMQAWSTGELSRLVHKHGGLPIGSFHEEEKKGHKQRSETGGNIIEVSGSPMDAVFMDCTHDNQMPTQKRNALDTLPNGALTAWCDCAVGSVMGYDEIYPKHLDIVNEKRRYKQSTADGPLPGIGDVRTILNQIHEKMGKEGFTEMHVHHEGEYITVHRVHPKTHRGYFLVAHTGFDSKEGRGAFNPVQLTQTRAKEIGSWSLIVKDSEEDIKKVVETEGVLTGLESELKKIAGPSIEEGPGNSSGSFTTTVTIPEDFPPGSISIFETWIPGAGSDEDSGDGIDAQLTSGAEEAFADLDLVDLNFVLYRADSEERDASGGKDGVYVIPDHGALVYAGLQGWWSVIEDVIRNNDLGHPLCRHLREGLWALEYIINRLRRGGVGPKEKLQKAADWFQERLELIKEVPGFLRPRYFCLIVKEAYEAAWAKGLSLMSKNIREGPDFVHRLAMVGVQMEGLMASTSLWPKKKTACCAAGLPHFAVDYMRCWGRDVFISLRGLFLATGRFDEAKEHILGFASVMKHGMIPNLLDGGTRPRYNARDSIWFFLQCIQDYVKAAPEGVKFLQEKVKRRFLPFDDEWLDVDDPRVYSKESTIEEIIFEALQRHAWGMSFREANAGVNLDMQMKWEGFQIDIKTDWETGLVFGGNQNNCGTWMDKMGESTKAGNKGVPGTPRDGAAIEIIGLLYSTLRWVAELQKKKQFLKSAVTKENKDGAEEVTFTQWADKIQASFEHCFYVPLKPEDDSKYDVNTKLVNRRGIYKDLYKSGKEWEDYQFRPNFAIALTVAPSLFSRDKVYGLLNLADEALRGPIGMATLDPKDLNYRPQYLNSIDSDDFATSKGRNYHQGPEWVWPLGYFFRAILTTANDAGRNPVSTAQLIYKRMAGCIDQIKTSPWRGITELTQGNGEFCGDSCPTQAWSSACLIDVFYDATTVAGATTTWK